ncbi:MAG: hypothetical protein H6635_00110 [Anaerolineales bacterium]|nr:hypothetical protein [Anaerolineales bacterium]
MFFEDKRVLQNTVAQQSVHLTLGILRKSQAVFYAFSFFWLDGFAVPRPSAGNANRWAAILLNKKASNK